MVSISPAVRNENPRFSGRVVADSCERHEYGCALLRSAGWRELCGWDLSYTSEVKLRILGSFGGDSPSCRMTSFLIDDIVAVDAGAITRSLTIPQQHTIRHVVITHTHMDHTASLPFLIENIFGSNSEPVSIYCTNRVLAGVRKHLFNNDTWPDFTRIPNRLYPSVRFEEIEQDVPFHIRGLKAGDLEVTAIPVNHIVPTTGLLLRQGGSSVLFTSDTGPTERVWQVANHTEDLAAVITECSFPNRLQEVADVSLHLSPQTLAAELAKLRRRVPVYLYHFKPPYVDELRDELAATKLPHPVIELEQDRTYEF
jgi:ribonuclease BN (tRNA processing enzyme)